MSDSVTIDNRMRALEHKAAKADVRRDMILDELKKVGASIEKVFSKVQVSLSELDERVRHIERLTGSLDGISLNHRDLSQRLADLQTSTNVRLSKLEVDLTTHLAQEAMTSKGISWAAAILGGLIASGITGVVGALATKLF